MALKRLTRVIGIDKVLANIKREFRAVEGRSSAGLMAAGLQVQRLAQKKVPVEYGNLRGSAYTEKRKQLEVEVGFTASYALYVHENLGQVLKGQTRRSGLGHYWGPAGEPKYLEKALKETDVIGIIAKYARVK